MPKSFRSNKKTPPQTREPMKPQQKQQKKSLQEVCQDRINSIHEARRQKEEAIKREKDRILEDEVMEMTYGPNWRTRYPWEPKTEDEIPSPEDSQIRLKAS